MFLSRYCFSRNFHFGLKQPSIFAQFLAMSYTPDSLEQHIQSLGIEIRKISHSPPVMTVADMEAQLKGDEGKVVKNIFLKDKKGRNYMVTALPETEVKINVLGARLAQGKTLRLAPDELLESVLQVPKGSVTPLALCQDTAANVVLLFDHKLQSEDKLLVHPLTNSASLALSASEIETILRSFGRQLTYVDLSLEPKFSKDNPGDLKYLSDAVALPEKPENGESSGVDNNSSKAKNNNNGKIKSASKQQNQQQHLKASEQADDVDTVIGNLLQMVKSKIKDGQLSEADMESLRGDFFVELNAMRNASYSGGYYAAMGAVNNFVNTGRR
eukprot:TRINITY_DN1023_c0_g1_i6.p1 TRINITY_DN1023_c0_g1~~TRINITY_DN1023_c0_g1_i6.p1  ORF type:complete len:328 (-),score=40.56 TRINITY_DN1023_c0_g1_i6:429-1412(-)